MNVALAQEKPGSFGSRGVGARIAPPTLQPRVSAEYFSADPDNRIQIPVNVWGAIKEPGIHFMPVGSTLTEAIGASGGPLLDSASLPEVTLIRNQERREVNILKEGIDLKLVKNDTIIVDTSIKKELPLYFSAATLLVSIASLIVISRRR